MDVHARTGSQARLSPAMFPREQPSRLTDFVRDVASLAAAPTFSRANTLRHTYGTNITYDKFTERNGSSVFLCPSGGAYDFSCHRRRMCVRLAELLAAP